MQETADKQNNETKCAGNDVNIRNLRQLVLSISLLRQLVLSISLLLLRWSWDLDWDTAVGTVGTISAVVSKQNGPS